MLKINEVVNGRIYSVIFESPVKMNVGGREHTNPLANMEVTKRVVMSVQACSHESYARRQIKADPTWTPSNRPSGYANTDHPCLDLNLSTDELALRCVPVHVTKREVFVGDVPASAEQLAIIAQYSPERPAPSFMRLPLSKVANRAE